MMRAQDMTAHAVKLHGRTPATFRFNPAPLKAAIVAALCLGVATAQAENQRLTASADGHVTFHAAVSGVTRVAIRDDRIRELVYAESNYEVKNDDTTGDIFLRYSGPGEGKDSGYIITESGNTISYTIEPRESFIETVLITVSGGKAASRAAAAPSPAPPPAASAPVVRTTRAAPSATRKATTSPVDAFVSAVVSQGIDGTSPPDRSRNNALVKRFKSDDYMAEVRVATARRDRVVDQSEYLKNGALAVWIAEPDLKAGEKSWVLVVKPLEDAS